MAIYYISTTGNDTTGAGTVLNPWRTFSKAFTVMVAGDTLYARGGIYAEYLNNNMPGGVSWSTPVTISSYPSETATIRPPSGSSMAIYMQGGTKKYIIYDRLDIDGSSLTTGGLIKMDRPSSGQQAAHHIKFINCEMHNTPHTAIVTTYTSDYNEFINCNLHDNGHQLDTSVSTPGGLYHYAFYIRGGYGLIDGCRIYNQGSSGFQIYSNDATTEPQIGWIIRNCFIYNNCIKSVSMGRGVGGAIAAGRDHQFYNNVVYNNPSYGGLRLTYCNNIKVYNNTFYGNTVGIDVAEGTNNIFLKNNISYGNTRSNIQIVNGGQATQANNFTLNPSFVNPSANNFQLQSSSSAIDVGITLPEVTSDILGVSRPQGSAYDAGAYEYVGGGIPDTTPPSGSIIFPTNGSTVSGNITISCSASDNVGVANVQFYLDGIPLGGPVT